jgi:hypothetical protein
MNELPVDYFYMALKSVFSLAVVVEPNVINMMMMCVYKAHSLVELQYLSLSFRIINYG